MARVIVTLMMLCGWLSAAGAYAQPENAQSAVPETDDDPEAAAVEQLPPPEPEIITRTLSEHMEMARIDAISWSEDRLEALTIALYDSPSHGLPPLDAWADRLQNRAVAREVRARTASRAYLQLASWLRFGLLDAETLEARRLSEDEFTLLFSGMQRAVSDGDVVAALEALAPPVRDYQILRTEMRRILAIRPIWPAVETGPAMGIGDAGDRVDQLRVRLAADGLLDGEWSLGQAYDLRLETAVRRFQGRVNLHPDGRVGDDTLQQLNTTPEDRLAQLRVNMEQRRWRSRELGERHIWVNIADFTLEAWERGDLVRRHQVMVGRRYSSTPEFSEEMRYIVLNPHWGVPAGLARSRFRSIRRNPAVARARGYTVTDSNGQRVSPYSIDWSRWSSGWPYRLSQAPGPSNPMGEVKFIFPNRYNVYLHDTTERDSFVRTRRDLSAGCVRVQDPLVLAAWVLNGQDGWDLDRIHEETAGNRARVVWLEDRIPVHIAYWTVVDEDDGNVRYLNDLYRRDRRTIRAFQAVYEDFEPAISRGGPARLAAAPALD